MALVLLAPALLVSNAAGQSITGRVFECVGTRHVPLRKALVLAGSPDGQQTFAVTRTDAEGRYLLAGEEATQAFGPAPCRLISPWEKKSPGSR